MARLKRKDFSHLGGFILIGVFILNCYLLNKLFFFIPDEWGWMNEAIKHNDTSYFMPLKTFLCLLISLPLTLIEIGLYFRLNKNQKSRKESKRMETDGLNFKIKKP